MKSFAKIITILVIIVIAGLFIRSAVMNKLNSIPRIALTISIPEKYEETAMHVHDAIANGHSPLCTIDRGGADMRREESLKNVPTKRGYDRDEYPMAMCLEGGEGADIRYISPSDNRGAGSWVGHRLSDYPDGTVIQFNQ